MLQIEPQPNVRLFEFDTAGDVVAVSALQSLQTAPLDEATGTWGVALLRLQANLPNTLPGQNVTFLIFGDTEIENAVTTERRYTPMQAFVLRTGLAGTECDQAPESGLLVQTPEGVGQVQFNVNGVDVSMGSTVYFQATPGENMTVRTVEGAAFLRVQQRVVPVLSGTQARFPVDDDLEIIEDEAYTLELLDEDIAEDLPLDYLEREIELDEPLTDEELEDIIAWVEGEECAADFGEESWDLCAIDDEFAEFDEFLDLADDEDFEDFDEEDLEDFDDENFEDDDFADEDFEEFDDESEEFADEDEDFDDESEDFGEDDFDDEGGDE
jgi:hypothetical protein